jgi:hypothetical protein
MKPKLLAKYTLLTAVLLLSLLTCLSRTSVEAQGVGAATVEILNPLSGDDHFIFNSTEYPINSTFTVDFYIVNVTGLQTWEIYFSWNNTVIHYQTGWIPKDNNVFAAAVKGGASILAGGPSLEIDGDQGYIKYGAVLLPTTYVDVPGVGLLCSINFTIAASPQDSQIYTNIVLIPELPMETSLDTYVILEASPVPVRVVAEPAIVRIQKAEILIVQDLAVASLAAEPSSVEIGDVTEITIALQNLGNDLETANVSIKYGGTLGPNQTLLWTLIAQFRQSLGPNQTLLWTYSWNTTGVSPGTYRLSVDIAPLPQQTDLSHIHAEIGITVAEKLRGLDYVRWIVLLWLNTPFGIFSVVYVSACIGFLAAFWAYRKVKSFKI